MGKFLAIIKWGIVLAVLIIGFVLWRTCERKGGVSVDVGFDPRIELTAQEIRHIEQIGQWEFLSLQSEVMVDTLRKGVFTDDRLVSVYMGVPRIGIDMNRVSGDWVQTHGDTVTLQLPAVHLLDRNFIDEARTRIFYESGKWSNRVRREQYDKAYRKMMRQTLTPENLRRAETNARSQFTAMFRAIGFQTVEIYFIR